LITSPPNPLSLAGEGVSSHEPGDDLGEVRYVLGTDAQDANAMVLEPFDPFEVVGEALLALKVHGAVDLERQPKLGAVEVDDVASHGLLATELETVAAAIAQQLPSGAFGRCGGATKLPSEVALGARYLGAADDGWLQTVPSLMGHIDLSFPPGTALP